MKKKITTTLFLLIIAHVAALAVPTDFEKGLQWKEKGNLVEAIKYFEKAVQSTPNQTAILEEYANATYQVGRYAQAIPAYEKLLKNNGRALPYLIRLARMYSFSTQKEISKNYADEALELQPSNPNDIFTLAEVFYFIREYPTALKLYEHITSIENETANPTTASNASE